VSYGGVLAFRVTAVTPSLPVVITFWGSDLLGGHVGGVKRRSRERFGVWASRRAALAAQGLIVQSAPLLHALPDQVDLGHVWTIPGGVDLDVFTPMDRLEARRRLGWRLDRPVVLFPAAQSRPEKRFQLAAESVDALRATVPEVELRVLDGVARDQVPLWMNAVDAVVLTSSTEGSPNAVKEALASCTHVVAVDVGDVRERCAGVPGSAVVDPDPASIAEALRAALASERTAAGRKRAGSISLERTAERIREVYGTVSARWARRTNVG
jgi:glycosyltransferase involved in cell wall biosynthesis